MTHKIDSVIPSLQLSNNSNLIVKFVRLTTGIVPAGRDKTYYYLVTAL